MGFVGPGRNCMSGLMSGACQITASFTAGH